MNMNRGDSVAFAYLVYKYLKKKKTKQRKFWMHPLNTHRYISGAFYTLYNDLRDHEAKFFNYFRMSISSFDELLLKVRSSLQKENTNMRNCVPPEEMLALTLRYLASGCSFADISYEYRIGKSTARKIVREVCQKLWTILQEECIPHPTESNWLNIVKGFETKANFPHCLGAIDGKHIRIIKPVESGSLYDNCKSYFSIVLLAVCDSNYMFTFVSIGAYGKDSDSAIFKETSFYKNMTDRSLNIPTANYIDGIDEPLPYVFVADEAFKISENIMRPYSGKCLPTNKKIYNYRLNRARRYIECSFGILFNKWRILHKPINVNVDFAVDITKATCVLHNYVRSRDCSNSDDFDVLDSETIDDNSCNNQLGDNQFRVGENFRVGQGNHFRDLFSLYFISDVGSVS